MQVSLFGEQDMKYTSGGWGETGKEEPGSLGDNVEPSRMPTSLEPHLPQVSLTTEKYTRASLKQSEFQMFLMDQFNLHPSREPKKKGIWLSAENHLLWQRI